MNKKVIAVIVGAATIIFAFLSATGQTTEFLIPKTNSQSGFLEGFQDSYKINETVEFELVFKDGQKCSRIEISFIDNKDSEFVNGFGFYDWCEYPLLSDDLRIKIPNEGENPPFKTDKIGSYTIVVEEDRKVVLEKEFVVKNSE